MLDKNPKRESLLDYNDSIMQLTSLKSINLMENSLPFKSKAPAIEGYTTSTPGSFKTFFWNNVVNYPENF